MASYQALNQTGTPHHPLKVSSPCRNHDRVGNKNPSISHFEFLPPSPNGQHHEMDDQVAIYEGFTPSPPRPKHCCFNTYSNCQPFTFPDNELEALFNQYVFTFRRRALNRFILLHIFVLVCILLLDFLFYRIITYRNVPLIALLSVHLLLFVLCNTRLMKGKVLPVATLIAVFMALGLVAVTIPWQLPNYNTTERSKSDTTNFSKVHLFGVGPQVLRMVPDGLWEVLFVIVSIYILAPLHLYSSVFVCLFISVVHTASASLCTGLVKICSGPQTQLPHNFWIAFGANLILHACCHLVGIIYHCNQERALRQAFLDTRDCIGNRISLQDENIKMERLVRCLVPEPLVENLKRDFIQGTIDIKVPMVVHLRNISLLSVEVCGLSGSVRGQEMAGVAKEMVKFMNTFFSKCDQLAQELGCYRVRLHDDEMLFLAGYPETRVDHAKSCVELAFGILQLINNVSETADVYLEVRTGVHTGEAFAAVLGNSRMRFDLLGKDAICVRQLQVMSATNRVLVSKASLDQLPDGYRPETGPSLEHGVHAFYLSPRSPKQNVPVRTSSTRLHQKPRLTSELPSQRCDQIGKLNQAVKFNVEVPLMFLNTASRSTSSLLDSDAMVLHPEFTKKPFKRSSINKDNWRLTLHKYMAETLVSSTHHPIKVTRSLSMNAITYRFHERAREKEFNNLSDFTFGRSMLVALVLLIAIAGLQSLVFPRTTLLVLIFMVALLWIAVILFIVLASKLKCFEFSMSSSATVRLVAIVTAVIFIYAVSQVNVFCCEFVSLNNTIAVLPISTVDIFHLNCPFPQYVPLTCALSLLLMVLFHTLPFLTKFILSILMVTTYTVIIEVPLRQLFDRNDRDAQKTFNSGHFLALFCQVAFLLLILVQSRFIEYIRRLGYLWKSQATTGQSEMETIRKSCHNVLNTILPDNVSLYFLDSTYRNPNHIYCREYGCIGSLCVSVPTWSPPGLSEPTAVAEKIRLLNQLICSFDKVLLEDRFKSVTKIFTVGERCLFATGILPQYLIHDNTSKVEQLSALVQLGFAFRKKADEFNSRIAEERLRLRIGMHSGPGFTGVLGGARPIFSLWGETSQVAHIVERSSRVGDLQITHNIISAVPVPINPDDTKTYEWWEIGALSVSQGHYCHVSPGGPIAGPLESLIKIYHLSDKARDHPSKYMGQHSNGNFYRPPLTTGIQNSYSGSSKEPLSSNPITASSISMVNIKNGGLPSQIRHMRPPNASSFQHPPPSVPPPPPGGVSTQNYSCAHPEDRFFLSSPPDRIPPPPPPHQNKQPSVDRMLPATKPADWGKHNQLNMSQDIIQQETFPALSVSPPIGLQPQHNSMTSPVHKSHDRPAPESPSSVGTFLALEEACAKTDLNTPNNRRKPKDGAQLDGRDKKLHRLQSQKEEIEDIGEENEAFFSHHNPLYTDNEYESMAESQSNLLDIIPLDERPPNSQSKMMSKYQQMKPFNGKAPRSSHVGVHSPPVGASIHSSVHSSGTASPRPSHNGSHRSAGSGSMLNQNEIFDFPNYKRPSSPALKANQETPDNLMDCVTRSPALSNLPTKHGLATSLCQPTRSTSKASPAHESDSLLMRSPFNPSSDSEGLVFSLLDMGIGLNSTSHQSPLSGNSRNGSYSKQSKESPYQSVFPENKSDTAFSLNLAREERKHDELRGRRYSTTTGGGMESGVSIIEDMEGMTSCDDTGLDSDVDAMRVQSDLVSDASDNPLISDLEDFVDPDERRFGFLSNHSRDNKAQMEEDIQAWHSMIHTDEPLMVPHQPRGYLNSSQDFYAVACPNDSLVMPASPNTDARVTRLPTVAAVGIPDFSRIIVSKGEGVESRDHRPNDPYPMGGQINYAEKIRRRAGRYTGASSPERSEYDNVGQSGFESDAISGYTGDVATSAYDSDEDRYEEDKYEDRGEEEMLYPGDAKEHLVNKMNGDSEQFHQRFTQKQESDPGKRSDYDNLESDASELIDDIRTESARLLSSRGGTPISRGGTSSSSGGGHRLWRTRQIRQPYHNLPGLLPPSSARQQHQQQLFQQQIAAEARRISSVFNWRDESVNGGSPPRDVETNESPVTNKVIALRGRGSSVTPCSGVVVAQPGVGAKIRSVKNRKGPTQSPYVNLSGSAADLLMRRSHSAEDITHDLDPRGGLDKLVLRLDRARHILPAELHSYVLPGCISSSSLASSMSCVQESFGGDLVPSDMFFHGGSDPCGLNLVDDSEYDNYRSDWCSEDDMSTTGGPALLAPHNFTQALLQRGIQIPTAISSNQNAVFAFNYQSNSRRPSDLIALANFHREHQLLDSANGNSSSCPRASATEEKTDLSSKRPQDDHQPPRSHQGECIPSRRSNASSMSSRASHQQHQGITTNV